MSIPTSERSRRSRPRVWLWLVVSIPLAIATGTGFLVALGAVFNYTGEELEVSSEERDLVLDIAYLAAWMDDYSPQRMGESVKKTRYIDDSYEIEYIYDLPEDTEAPYLSYSLTFERNETDATATFRSYWGGTQVAFMMLGDRVVSVEEDNNVYRWGDRSKFGILRADGEPFGNVFLAKKGQKVVYLLVSGLYFDDGRIVSALLTPYLEKLDAYVPAP